MTCPVTFGCYSIIDKEYVTSGRWTFLYEDLHETWLEGKQTILDDEPTKQTQALRAFYALEYMYFCLLPSMMRASEHLRWKHNFQEQYERSCEGLDLLLRVCEQTERRIIVDKGTCELTNRDPSAFTFATIVKPLDMLHVIREAAALLRKHMAGGDNPLNRMGEWLGHSLVATQKSLDVCIKILQALNSISIHNPVSPCNTTRKYLV